MNNNLATNQYFQNSVNTASPADLTLMLYNGLVKFLMKAAECIIRGDFPKAHDNIIRSQDILCEFQATLDMKYPVSRDLTLLYDYMKRRLVDANVKKDAEIVGEVLGFARELRDTWAIAMKKSGTHV